MIAYVDDLRWKSERPFLTTDAESFVKRLENAQTTFEMTGPVDAVCRVYFDIDYKGSDMDWKYDMIEEEATKYIKDMIMYVNNGFEPEITIATSHGFTSKNQWKISFRFWINMKAKKSEIHTFIKQINKYIVSDAINPFFTGILEDMNNKLFDEDIYDHNRKMRCIGMFIHIFFIRNV
jgi:hypothetical protein